LVYEGQIEDIGRERAIYYRNSGETSLAYTFGAEDLIAAGYRNIYADDTSRQGQNSRGHEAFANLEKWFGPRFGVGVTSLYNWSALEETSDFDQYGAGLTLNYRWVASRRVYTRYDFLDHKLEEPPADSQRGDFRDHEAVLGISMPLGPHAEFSAEGGYYFHDYDNGDDNDGPVYKVSFNTQTQRSSIRLEVEGGLDERYYAAETLGPLENQTVFGIADYLLTENLLIFGSGNFGSEDYFEIDRKDEFWSVTAGLSLSFWRWLQLSLQGTYTDRDSDDPAAEFKDNRVMLRLSAGYPYTF
jgi:hypothetical protein